MIPNSLDVCSSRAALIAQSLARHRLVIVQLGAAFEPLREGILSSLGGARLSVLDLESRDDRVSETHSGETVIVEDLEQCASAHGPSLGSVRERVMELLDHGQTVCLFSRFPRAAFAAVPGSSIVEDAALVILPLLSEPEMSIQVATHPPIGWRLPIVMAEDESLAQETYVSILRELGQEVIAAVDHALFEIDPKTIEGLRFLGARELEALRCAGLIEFAEDSQPALTAPGTHKGFFTIEGVAGV